jgi:hypothetical protein
MEKQRPAPTYILIPSINPLVPTYIDTNRAGWQFDSNKQSTNEVELTTIYKPITTSTKQEEKKPFLRTINSNPNPTLMKEFYNEALQIFDNKECHNRLIQLITFMNSAKTKNINENIMGKYAYDTWKQTDTDASVQVILTFGYLKNYHQKALDKKENLPKYEDISSKKSDTKIGNLLAHTLGLSSPQNSTISTYYVYDSQKANLHYPAFYELKNNVQKLNYDIHINFKVKNFIDYIYSQHEMPKNRYHGLSYDELKNECCEKASYLLTHYWDSKSHSYLYNLIHIIEAGKTLNPPKQAYDFGYDIIVKDPTFTGKTLAFLNMEHMNTSLPTRKKIGILCHLIKQYNDKNKKTPTEEQYKNHDEGQWLYIVKDSYALPDACEFSALPNSFDTTLFDKKIYAFDEFKKLEDNLSILRRASDEHVEECIQQIYPPKK